MGNIQWFSFFEGYISMGQTLRIKKANVIKASTSIFGENTICIPCTREVETKREVIISFRAR